MRRSIFTFFVLWMVVKTFSQVHISDGLWRGALVIDKEKGLEIPFIFNVYYAAGEPSITIINGEEKIVIDEIKINGDSAIFQMPFFDTEFKCKVASGIMSGVWINHSKKINNVMPFSAVFGQTQRFKSTMVTRYNFEGRWETTFGVGTPDSSKAIGVFKQDHQIVTGTFMTETGDYRYLEGIANGNELRLSSFDGSHAYLFVANVNNKDLTLDGDFYSGLSSHEKFAAKRNDKFELRDPYSISRPVKDEPVSFTYPNLEGKKISLSDEMYANKVVIVQLMGSWCSNCMDETAYLSTLYNKYKEKGLEIIALAYERTDDMEKAKANVQRFKDRFGAPYEFLLTGLTGAASASKSMPWLSSVTAFPTTLYLNKNHVIEKVYTGFNGPATGDVYKKMQSETDTLLNNLLK